MSYTEHHCGILKPIDQDPEQYAKDYITLHNDDIDDNFLEAFLDIYYDKYILIKNKLYQIEDEDISNDVEKFIINGDGSITYYVSFYNGGACLHEALKYLIEDK